MSEPAPIKNEPTNTNSQPEQNNSGTVEPPLVSINKEQDKKKDAKSKGNPGDRMQEMMRQNKALKDERRTQVN